MKTILSLDDQNKINALHYSYDELVSQFRNYLNMNGYIQSEDKNKINALRDRYDELISQYRYYLDVNGYIYPTDFEEFFAWFIKFRHPNKPIVTLEIHPNDLKRFHEYEARRINNTGWNDAKEYKFLNDIEKHNSEESNI
jgi:hypothetical protein